MGIPPQLDVKFTATITVVNGAWSADVPITIAENLRGGWWALIATAVQVAGGLAYRWVFPQQMQGTKAPWRPGGLCVNALGDTPEEYQWQMRLGDQGYFWTFALPTLQVLSVTGGGTSVTGFMRIAYLGANQPSFIV